jgi:hypothetical protein
MLLTARAVAAQTPSVPTDSATGSCWKNASTIDLTTLVSEPDSAPRSLDLAPRMPAFARRTGYSGRVVLAVVVDSSGRTERSSMVLLESTDLALSVWVCAWALDLKWRPAMHNGRPVRAQATLPFTFNTLRGRPFGAQSSRGPGLTTAGADRRSFGGGGRGRRSMIGRARGGPAAAIYMNGGSTAPR